LSEAIRRKPYSVVLFDEIEKAHPDVFNVLLQVLDDGRLTDNKGRTVNFKNTIIIMTSNIGSHIIRDSFENIIAENYEVVAERTKQKVFELLKQTIRPEFLNRIDELIMFKPLSEQQISDIVRIQIEQLLRMLAKNAMQLQLTEKAIAYIAKEGFDPQFGARPVKRAVQKLLLNDLSKKILSGQLNANTRIIIDANNEGLTFENN